MMMGGGDGCSTRGEVVASRRLRGRKLVLPRGPVAELQHPAPTSRGCRSARGLHPATPPPAHVPPTVTCREVLARWRAYFHFRLAEHSLVHAGKCRGSGCMAPRTASQPFCLPLHPLCARFSLLRVPCVTARTWFRTTGV